MINIIRTGFETDRTTGILTATSVKRKYVTLEDAVRPYGLKIPHQTAIPAGVYVLTTRYSPSFGREMLMLVSAVGIDEVWNEDQPFKYIYLHGGTDPAHSSGCVLMPGLNSDEIWELLYREIGERVVIVNDFG